MDAIQSLRISKLLKDYSVEKRRETPSRVERCVDICKRLNEQRIEDRFCDATFVVGDRTFPVHKIVILSSSQCFADMFSFSSDSDKTQVSTEVVLPGESPDIFSVLLSYMYGQEVNINCDNIKDVCFAADKYGLQSLVKDCEVYIRNNWETSLDLPTVYEIAELLKMNEITGDILNINFLNSHCVAELPFSFLETICEKLILERISGEEQLNKHFRMAGVITKWAKAKPEERLPEQVLQLISRVRSEFMTEYQRDRIIKALRKESQFRIKSVVELYRIFCSPPKIGMPPSIIAVYLKISKLYRQMISPFHLDNWHGECLSCQPMFKPENYLLSDDILYMFSKAKNASFNLLTSEMETFPSFSETSNISTHYFLADNIIYVISYNDSRNVIWELKDQTATWIPVGSFPDDMALNDITSITVGKCVYFVCSRSDSRHMHCFVFHSDTGCLNEVCILSFYYFKPLLAYLDGTLYVFPRQNGTGEEIVVEKGILRPSEVDVHFSTYALLDAASVKEGILLLHSFKDQHLLGIWKPTVAESPEPLGFLEGLHKKKPLLYQRINRSSN